MDGLTRPPVDKAPSPASDKLNKDKSTDGFCQAAHLLVENERLRGYIKAAQARPWIIHVTGSTLGIKDANKKIVFRVVVSRFSSADYERLRAAFELIVAAVNQCFRPGELRSTE